MAVNCPQCGSAMAEVNATSARCARHGAYEILYKRTEVDDTYDLTPDSTPPPQAASPYVPQYAAPYGQQIPYAQVRNLGPCQNHQQVAATHYCSRCSARICSVCDFSFPGNIHFCPRCITLTSGGLSPGRKGMMIAAYIMAAVATLLFAGLITAGATGGIENMIVVIVLFFSIVVCIVVGAGLGIGPLDRKLGNPISLWLAAGWNIVLAAGLILAMIVVLMRQGE
jgi:hypothetical protein